MTNVTAWADDEDRLRHFAAEIDELRARVEAEIGAEDLDYIKNVQRFSRGMEVLGRGLLHFSVGPVGFFSGVGALWLHKQLQAIEIGHTVLHGTFDKIEGAEAFRSKTFTWGAPIHEESWSYAHNVRHHQYTNITGRDPDIRFGVIRWNEQTPYDPERHRFHIPALVLVTTHLAFMVNLQHTGLGDFLLKKDMNPEQLDFSKERTPEVFRAGLRKALRKALPYYAREYVLYPMLAGPMFWKVMLGNYMSELGRDIYSSLSLYCGHYGDDVPDYAEGTRAGSRHHWYAMQVESSCNFEVPLPLTILCGTLNRQIEHHLFPRFPTNRLRQIAPEVREICERHGMPYRTESWTGRLRKVFGRLARLSRPTPNETAAMAAE
jgi:NADPH-dependent stearoyl-CoA 9-desaturase